VAGDAEFVFDVIDGTATAINRRDDTVFLHVKAAAYERHAGNLVSLAGKRGAHQFADQLAVGFALREGAHGGHHRTHVFGRGGPC
jgi:hypothetical protein